MPTKKSPSTRSAAPKKAAVVKKVAPVKKAAPVKKVAAPAKKAAPVKKAAAPARKVTPVKKAMTAVKKAVPAVKKLAPAAKAGAPVKKVAPVKKNVTLDKFTEGQKALLFEERATYMRQATTLRAEADQLAQDRDPGDVQFDEESGQGDSMNVERERDLALSASALAAVEEIDRALEKMVAGTYGVCEKCGENIPKERLKALPYASLCVKCKSGGLSRR